ncbi:NUDIX domain-containing protein [Anaerolineales bacterium HSG6]|nr:NUDIX domain-containing protein [Anaerolineales bacterium HSG6]
MNQSRQPDEITLTIEQTTALRQAFKYCPRCRTEMVTRLIYGRERPVCPDETCRFVQFIDPKVSAAVMAFQQEKVLLIQRKVRPAKGSWCFPGGFMEMGETPQQTAQRECKEESGFQVEIGHLLDVHYYESFRGSGILILYQGQIIGGTAQAGDDAKAVGLFAPDELPKNIVFESNLIALANWTNRENNANTA